MKSMLYRVVPVDPPTFVAMSAFLLLAALAASWIPAFRASRVDPMETLRAE